MGTGDISSVKDITSSGNITGTFTGTVNSSSGITCTSLNTTNGNITMGTGGLSSSGALSSGAITCTSVNTTNGNLTLGTGGLSSSGALSSGAITCTSVNTTNGNLTMGTGDISSVKDISSTGNITGTFTGTINSSSGVTCTSLNTTNGNITLGTGGLSSSGALSSGAITCTSVNTTNGNLTLGTGGLSSSGALSSGAITCTSVNTTNGNLTMGTGDISSVKDISSTGTIKVPTIETSSTTTDLNIANNQTTSALNIGTAALRNGPINIGTGSVSATASDITLGNGNVNTVVGGNLTVNGSLALSTINSNLIKSVLAADNTNIYDNQTTGTLSIGNAPTRTGRINIGTANVTTSGTGVYIGSSLNPVTINGNLNVLGGFSFGSSAFNAITSVLATDTANLYNNQTSGVLNIGTSSTRTGAIHIGDGAAAAAGGIFIGNTFNNTTTEKLKVNGTLTLGDDTTAATANVTLTAGNLTVTGGNINNNTIQSTTATTAANIMTNQTSGTLSIGNGSSRTGNIYIGNQATGGTAFIGSSGMRTAIGGDLKVENGIITTDNIQAPLATDSMIICDQQTTGILYLGTTPSGRTGSVVIGATTCITQSRGPIEALSGFNNGVTVNSGGLTVTSGGVTVTAGGISLGTTPPTLTLNSLGYYYNFPLLTVTGITTTGQRYSPIANLITGPNQFNSGVYEAVINVVYRYTSSPSAFQLNYNFGIATGQSIGVGSPSILTDISPISRTNTGTLITGANNNDFSSSHVLGFTLTTGGFLNLFFNVTSLTITGGTLTINMYGTVKRIA